MIDHNRRVQLADELLRRFASAFRGAQLYAPAHPLVSAQHGGAHRSHRTGHRQAALDHARHRRRRIRRRRRAGAEGERHDERPAATAAARGRRAHRHRSRRRPRGNRVARDGPGLARPASWMRRSRRSFPTLPHIQIGRIQVEQRVDTSLADMASIRAMYSDAAKLAERLWDQAAHEGRPDPGAARGMVDTLAQAVAQNRTALIALTALKNYDNYTFTHMVNVSILTMAQARGLGIDGPLLREFGLAGLMHDIGKVRTPTEILNKPGEADRRRVRDHEAARRRRRRDPAADAGGAAASRRSSPSSTTCARDGTGYPNGVTRDALNLVHDALLDLGRLRRDAIAAQVSAGVPERTHPGRARSATTASSSISTSCGASCSSSASIRPATSCGSTRARSAVVLRVYAPDPAPAARARASIDRGGTAARTPLRSQPVGEHAGRRSGPRRSSRPSIPPSSSSTRSLLL